MSTNLSAAQTNIRLTLLNLLNQIPVSPQGASPGSNLIGPLDPQRQLLRMPKVSSDGRRMTWTKAISLVACKFV